MLCVDESDLCSLSLLEKTIRAQEEISDLDFATPFPQGVSNFAPNWCNLSKSMLGSVNLIQS